MELTDQQITAGLIAEDPLVFRHLYQNFGPKIMGYVLKNSGSQEEAHELLQTTTLKVWQNVVAGQYQANGKFKQYYFAVAVNTWRHTLRSKKRGRLVALTDEEFRMADPASDEMLQAIVKEKRYVAIFNALETIGNTCKELITLFYIQETPLKDIAETQQIEYGTVRKRIFDCRNKLKKLVDSFDF